MADRSHSPTYETPVEGLPPARGVPLLLGLALSAVTVAVWNQMSDGPAGGWILGGGLLLSWLSALAAHCALIARGYRIAMAAALRRAASVSSEHRRDEDASGPILRSFYDTASIMMGVVELTPAGDIRHLSDNAAAARFFGRSPADLRGRLASEMGVPPELVSEWAARYRESESLGEPVRFEYLHETGEGPRWLAATVTPLGRAGGRSRFSYLVDDVTERRRAEEALRASESSILSLYNLASAQSLSFNEKAQAMLEVGCQRFGLEIGILARVQGTRYEVVAARSPDNAIVRGAVLELSDTYCRETLEARSTVSFEHAGASPRKAHPAYSAWGMESYLGAPVRVAGRIFGTLNFAGADPRPAPFKPADHEFLKLMTLWLGGELEREQRNSEIVVLSELGGLLQTCDSTGEAYEVISRQGRKLFPDLAGAVYRIGSSRQDMELVASWGECEPIPGEDLFRPEDCWALRLGRDHLVTDPAADLICRHVGELVPPQYLCLPMMALGEALGVLHLRAQPPPDGGGDSDQLAAAPLNEARRRLASAVAEHTAMALANLTLRETLRHQSIRDPLTGLFNRRYFEESLEREIRRAQRRGVPLGVVMLDLDRFKRFNDGFGHEAGDVLLRALGELLRCKVRGEDVPCRYGGEEFAVLLPDATLDATRERAEELRLAAKGLTVAYQGQLLGPVTLSLGVAVYPDQGMSGLAVLRAADAALYQSKAEGRDRVTAALQIAS